MHSIRSSSRSASTEVRPLSSFWQSGFHRCRIKLQGRRHGYGVREQKRGAMVLVVRCGRSRNIPKDQLLAGRPPIDHVQAVFSVLTLEDTNRYAALDYHSKSMKVPDWFSLFEELGKRDKWLAILEVFRWMQQQRWYRPDDGFYSKIISILGKKGQLRLASGLFRDMKKHGCPPDTSVVNALITAHIRNNNRKELGLLKAFEYHEQMKKTTTCRPNLVTYNILLRGCAQTQQPQKMEELFEEMEVAGFKPDIYTFNGILDAYGKAGDFEAMDPLLRRMRQCKVKADCITYNTMIDAYGKAGRIDKMEEALKNMAMAKLKPQLSTVNALINNYGAAKCVDQMELVLTTMSDLGIRPTLITYEVLIKGYGNCKCFDKMQKCLEVMCNAGIRPEITTLNAIMEAYSSNGLFNAAEDLLDNAVVVPTSLTYRILYKGYLQHGLMDKADALLKRMDAEGMAPDENFLLHTLEASTRNSKPRVLKNASESRKAVKSSKGGSRKADVSNKLSNDDSEKGVLDDSSIDVLLHV
ncbi:hypothetical protein GOP47_0026712 [Adiantum capillus-veneris]|nr:hypothetical protein GOP47_0026712 [Adiantum capillus-veneris]